MIWNGSLALAPMGFDGIIDTDTARNMDSLADQQDSTQSKISFSLTERNISIKKKKTSFLFNYGARVQTRFDVSRLDEKGAKFMDELYFRRVRVKSDGYFFNSKLGYKLEIDVIGGQVLDAALLWNFYENFVLWGGQTKLRGNRERVISSQNLQMVDRSLLNAKFTLDRDLGFWLMHHINVGNSVVRESVSVSKGEGLSILQEGLSPSIKGLEYTARLEYLPFGFFANNGDYKGADLEREPKPKLSIGLTYDYNNNTAHPNADNTSETYADLGSWFADAMFKYCGFSFMVEYVNMQINDLRCDLPSDCVDNSGGFYTGTALNLQSGYLFMNNYEIAGRYTQVRPRESSSFTDQTEYTLAISKYIVGQAIKVQTDVSLLEQEHSPNSFIYRIQLELSF